VGGQWEYELPIQPVWLYVIVDILETHQNHTRGLWVAYYKAVLDVNMVLLHCRLYDALKSNVVLCIKETHSCAPHVSNVLLKYNYIHLG
jgi:hypothetical protein